jgi:hypothetical protein
MAPLEWIIKQILVGMVRYPELTPLKIHTYINTNVGDEAQYDISILMELRRTMGEVFRLVMPLCFFVQSMTQ